MDDNFSPKVKDVIAYSKEEALRLGHEFIGTEHLMLGLLRKANGDAYDILSSFEINFTELRRKIELLNPISNIESVSNKKSLHLTKQAEKALKTTFLEAKLYKSDSISTAHLLLCILRNENDPTTQILHKFDIFYEDVKDVFKELFVDSDKSEEPRADLPHQEEFNEPKKNPFEGPPKSKISKKNGRQKKPSGYFLN